MAFAAPARDGFASSSVPKLKANVSASRPNAAAGPASATIRPPTRRARDAGQAPPEQPRGVPGPEDVAGNELGDDRVVGGRQERLGGTERDRRDVDVLDAQLATAREEGHERDDEAADQVAGEDECAPRDPVGDRTAEEQEGDARRGAEADGDPELER